LAAVLSVFFKQSVKIKNEFLTVNLIESKSTQGDKLNSFLMIPNLALYTCAKIYFSLQLTSMVNLITPFPERFSLGKDLI